jgi:hypothetical protein
MMPLRFVMIVPSFLSKVGEDIGQPGAPVGPGCRRRRECSQSSRELSGRAPGSGRRVWGCPSTATSRPPGKDLARETGPADVRRAREMVGAAGRRSGHRRDGQAGRGDVGRRGRAADLVGDDGQPVAAPRRSMVLTKLAPWARTPRTCAGSHGTRPRPHAGLRRPAWCAIGPQRAVGRPAPGRVARAVEDVVGGDMHEGDAQRRAGPRHGPGRRR